MHTTNAFESASALAKGSTWKTALIPPGIALLGGIIVFGDPMPSDALGIIVQAFAFVLVVVAALVTPPPIRAAAANA